MRFRSYLLLMLILVALAIPAAPAAAQEFDGEYYDVDNHWAGEVIARCRAHQLMNGYPGNVFMPDQSLTRAEALVVIGRGLGWEAQAGSISTSGIKFPADLWVNFRGYVAVAASKGLITSNDIPRMMFNDPAPRIEVAVWMARAFNLTGNAAALNFNDLSQVPAAHRTALAGVVEAGILQGLPGNLIAPGKPLTRAEMAAILARLVDGGKINPASGRQVSGKIKTVSLPQQKITVESAHGANTYDLAGSYLVYRGGRKSHRNDLVAGEDVRITLDPYGRCIIIANGGGTPASGQQAETYTGTVVSLAGGYMIFQPDGGNAMGFNLSPSASVTVSGAGSSLSDLAPGARGTITVSGGLVTEISISGGNDSLPSGNRGYVVNKYLEYFTVRLGFGRVEEIWTAGVVFTRNGLGSSYGSLNRGSYVELVKTGPSITAVRILDGESKVFGEVQTAYSRSITIEDEDGKDISFEVRSGVRVLERDGDRIDIDDLESGQYVELTLDENGVVRDIVISREAGKDLEGTVEELRTSGSRRITIRDDDGDRYSYYLADSVTVREEGYVRDLDDVENDMRVELTLNSDDRVILIEIIGSSSVEGEVVDLKFTDTERIDIEKSSGTRSTYYLAGGVTVREGSITRDLDDLDEGMYVRLNLDRDDRVTLIEIIDEATVEGEVTYVSYSGSDRIRVKKNSGSESTYYLEDDVIIKDDGRYRDFSDIEEGMDVRLTLDSGGDVTRIDILSSGGSSDTEGEVTHIQAAGSNRFIEIKDNGGRERIYDLTGSVTVWEGGASRSLNYIVVGMKADLYLNGSGDVYRIEIERNTSGSSEVEGEVTYISISGRKRITIKEDDGSQVTYYLDDYVTVRESGSVRDLEDIEEGMYVNLTLDNTEVARIDIFGSDTVDGVVTYIRTSGTERIEIEEEDGDDGVYYLEDDVRVVENGDSRELDEVEKGMRVRLTLDRHEDVTRIEITGLAVVEGEVTYIRRTDTRRIEIEKNNGDEEAFYIRSDVVVREGNSGRDLDDVHKGDDVELTLDEEMMVTHIQIL